jgi:hypothetical protein
VFLPLSHAEKQLSDPTQRIHKVLETARILYGLIHARYVLTAQGLTDMVRRLAWCWLCTLHARARALSLLPARSFAPRVTPRALVALSRALSTQPPSLSSSPSLTASSRFTLTLLEPLGSDQPPRSHQS